MSCDGASVHAVAAHAQLREMAERVDRWGEDAGRMIELQTAAIVTALLDVADAIRATHVCSTPDHV